MYTMAPEDYFRYWAEDEARRARGHTPVPAETGRVTTRSGFGGCGGPQSPVVPCPSARSEVGSGRRLDQSDRHSAALASPPRSGGPAARLPDASHTWLPDPGPVLHPGHLLPVPLPAPLRCQALVGEGGGDPVEAGTLSPCSGPRRHSHPRLGKRAAEAVGRPGAA